MRDTQGHQIKRFFHHPDLADIECISDEFQYFFNTLPDVRRAEQDIDNIDQYAFTSGTDCH